MKTLSMEEINAISGAFSAENILDSAEAGAFIGIATYVGLLILPIPAIPLASCIIVPTSCFIGLSLLHEAAASFDRHYGCKF